MDYQSKIQDVESNTPNNDLQVLLRTRKVRWTIFGFLLVSLIFGAIDAYFSIETAKCVGVVIQDTMFFIIVASLVLAVVSQLLFSSANRVGGPDSETHISLMKWGSIMEDTSFVLAVSSIISYSALFPVDLIGKISSVFTLIGIAVNLVLVRDTAYKYRKYTKFLLALYGFSLVTYVFVKEPVNTTMMEFRARNGNVNGRFIFANIGTNVPLPGPLIRLNGTCGYLVTKGAAGRDSVGISVLGVCNRPQFSFSLNSTYKCDGPNKIASPLADLHVVYYVGCAGPLQCKYLEIVDI